MAKEQPQQPEAQDQEQAQEQPQAPSEAPAGEGQGGESTQDSEAPRTGRRPGQEYDQ